MTGERNPVVFPTQVVKPRGCPKCGGVKFTGRMIQGVANMRCLDPDCKNEWQGGLSHEPEDPRKPVPPDPNPPYIDQMARTDKHGVIVETYEVRRPINQGQSFRSGSKIPDGEDY